MTTTTPNVLTLFVPGRPAPQGSKRAVRAKNGRAILIESSPRVKDWRGDVRRVALEEWGDAPPHEGPVGVSIGFDYPRPLAHHVASKRARPLKDGAPTWKPSVPDLDKLARAILDALSGIVYLDDAQVVTLNATKGYGERPGARIVVRPISSP